MNKSKIDEYLSMVLLGYEENLKSVSSFLEDAEKQIETAKEHRMELIGKISELKDALGLEDEAETPEEESTLKLVKD
tara:strand:- start:13423 stop:13653 length:231 start_codon:yes stop_codon:yes gene_type:complete